MPSSASRRMLGVRYRLLSAVTFFQNGSDVSCQPMSSTKKKTMLGRWGRWAAAREGNDAETSEVSARLVRRTHLEKQGRVVLFMSSWHWGLLVIAGDPSDGSSISRKALLVRDGRFSM